MAWRAWTGLLAGLALAAAAPARRPEPPRHEGVASCGGTTCHGRQIADGAVVRQNELLTWQDDTSLTGAHSRAASVLDQPRARAIAARLGIGAASASPQCLGCHGDTAARRGPRFQAGDGVGCEVCHGGSERWLASHTRVGVSHAANVAAGMIPVDDVRVRANLCLDCHFGSARAGQFVDHRMMAAGHPRLVFELDLFTSLQRHHDEDADYRARKHPAGVVRSWAVGQALALDRSLTLLGGPRGGGAFPEFVFFDCRSCHRAFTDDPAARFAGQANPLRPVPPGAPVFNDENIILLGVAARAVDPALAAKLETQARALHVALTGDRAGAQRAGAALAGTARALAARFEAAPFDRAQTAPMLRDVLSGRASTAYTDYQGGTQAVMAAETLIAALVADGQLSAPAAKAARPDIDRAYAAVRDANAWRPADFRAAMARIGGVVGAGR